MAEQQVNNCKVPASKRGNKLPRRLARITPRLSEPASFTAYYLSSPYRVPSRWS